MRDQLVKKIKGIMVGIKTGTKAKEKSGIGALLIQLKKIDEPAHNELMAEYTELVSKK